MAARRRLYIDKAELTLLVNTGKSIKDYHLLNGDFSEIIFDKHVEHKFGLFPQDSEKIFLRNRKVPEGITILKSQHKEFFDTYKEEIAAYAKEYRIPLKDNTK